MRCNMYATPWPVLASVITYIVCAPLTLSGISTALDIFSQMGVLADDTTSSAVWNFAVLLFTLIAIADLILLAYIWWGKMALRDHAWSDNCSAGLCCSECMMTIILALYWACIITYTVLVLILPALAALLYAARTLCGLGGDGAALLIELSAHLPMLSLSENADFLAPYYADDAHNASHPPPPAPPSAAPSSHQAAIPAYCALATEHAGSAAGMLFSCAPFLLITQMIVLSSASTVMYVLAVGKREKQTRTPREVSNVQLSGID